MGELDVTKFVHKHQVWCLLMCIWLHAGVFHLLANMLCLLVIAILNMNLDLFVFFLIRTTHIGVLYVVSGFVGSLLSAIFRIPCVSAVRVPLSKVLLPRLLVISRQTQVQDISVCSLASLRHSSWLTVGLVLVV